MRESEEHGETERMLQHALSLALSIAGDLRQIPSKRRSQLLVTRSEELYRQLVALSVAVS